MPDRTVFRVQRSNHDVLAEFESQDEAIAYAGKVPAQKERLDVVQLVVEETGGTTIPHSIWHRPPVKA
jgi:hypothetical protein